MWATVQVLLTFAIKNIVCFRHHILYYTRTPDTMWLVCRPGSLGEEQQRSPGEGTMDSHPIKWPRRVRHFAGHPKRPTCMACQPKSQSGPAAPCCIPPSINKSIPFSKLNFGILYDHRQAGTLRRNNEVKFRSKSNIKTKPKAINE